MPPQYELNLYDYWRILRRRRYIFFSVVFIVFISTVFYTKLQTPIYQASSVVKIEPLLIIPGIATEAWGWDMLAAINTEVKVIKSALMAEKTARYLGWITDDTPKHRAGAIINSLQAKISAERIGDTNLVRITATSSDRKEVAILANAVAEVYIQKGIEDRSRRAKELRMFVEQQLLDAETKLKEREEKLRKFVEETGAVGVGHHIAIRMLDLEAKKNELLKRYTELHPEVRKINDQLKVLEEQLKTLPKEEIEYARLTRELKLQEELYSLLAKRHKEALISEADRIQPAYTVTPAVEPTLPIKPKPMMNYTLGILLGLVLGTVMSFLAEHLDTSIATIEDVEKYLNLPVIGVIPHIEIKDRKKRILKMPTKFDRIQTLRKNLIIYHSLKSPFVEAYHTLRTNIQYIAPEAKIILFTSTGIGEGKTLTALNFALAAAISGVYTLLIEADLRRPNVHRIFGISRIPGFNDVVLRNVAFENAVRGISDLIVSEIALEKVVHTHGLENFKFLTSGVIPPNPVNLFMSDDLSSTLAELRDEFELIVLDVSPILLFADALLLSKNVDGVVIVYKVGKIARGALKRAKDQLVNTKANILGVVLNDIKASEMEPRYGYYYAYRYYIEKEPKPSKEVWGI